VSICRLFALGSIFVIFSKKKNRATMTDKKKKSDHHDVEMKSEETNQTDVKMDDEAKTESENETEGKKDQKDSHKLKKDKSQEKIIELENALVELVDKHLRLQAEFDNFRKRTLKEKAELIKSGGETVLSNILPIIDDFDRALGTMKEVSEDDPAKIGFLLIFNKFKEFMKQSNVKEIEATGASFDVDLHFALTKIPAPSEELKGKVVDVVEKGYLLNDRVLRYAKVVIGE
jgi:molecular chaperone GrpE